MLAVWLAVERPLKQAKNLRSCNRFELAQQVSYWNVYEYDRQPTNSNNNNINPPTCWNIYLMKKKKRTQHHTQQCCLEESKKDDEEVWERGVVVVAAVDMVLWVVLFLYIFVNSNEKKKTRQPDSVWGEKQEQLPTTQTYAANPSISISHLLSNPWTVTEGMYTCCVTEKLWCM